VSVKWTNLQAMFSRNGVSKTGFQQISAFKLLFLYKMSLSWNTFWYLNLYVKLIQLFWKLWWKCNILC